MTTQDDQPVGAPVDPNPALLPSKDKFLEGHLVILRRLTAPDATSLYPLLGGLKHAHLFTYMSDPPPTSPSHLTTMLAAKAASTDPLFYTILHKATSEPVGWCALMRIDAPNRVLEIGHLMFSRALQRTPAATEVPYLLLCHAFDELGYRRVEWKCDSLNAPSRRAAGRLGFVYEGTFRQHMVYKGRNRDTCWFSMLDGEWGKRRAEMEAWLAQENFDSEDKQRRRLEEFRKGAGDGEQLSGGK